MSKAGSPRYCQEHGGDLRIGDEWRCEVCSTVGTVPCKCGGTARVFGAVLPEGVKCDRCGEMLMGVDVPDMRHRWNRGERGVVWKCDLSIGEGQELQLPKGARALHVSGQLGAINIWFQVDRNAERECRRFDVVGTGWPMGAYPLRHCGTAIVGEFVWHVFERIGHE